MQCNDFKQALLNVPVTPAPLAPEFEAHGNECDSCRAFKEETLALNALLFLDEESPPRPGFDTRFFARLEEVKTIEQTPLITRLLSPFRIWALAAAVCAAVLVLVVEPTMTPPDPLIDPDISLAMELDMIEDLEVLAHLDEIEDFDVIEQLNLDDFEALNELQNSNGTSGEVRFQ